nr:CBS domain-containing protein [Negativicutes bacterium]
MFVKEWKSRGLITVAPNATLDEALKLMETNKIRRLPVVDGGKLV